MKSHLFILFAFFSISKGFTQAFPERADTSGRIYDFAKLFTQQQCDSLELLQISLYEKTGIDLLFVSADSFNGMTAQDFNTGLSKHWELNPSKNQMLITVREGSESKRWKVYISTNYGDVNKRIQRKEVRQIIRELMKAEYKRNEVFKGTYQAIDYLLMRL